MSEHHIWYTEDVGEENAEYRETDSDSDGYDPDGTNSPEQRRTANALRALTSYLSFEIDEKVRERVTAAMLALIKTPSDGKVMQAIVDVHKEIKDKPKILAFKEKRIPHAAAIALYAISPHVRLTHTKVNHGELLEKFLTNMTGGQDLVRDHVRTISLFAYWSGETMAYCKVAEKLLSITDSEYDPDRVTC